MMIPRGKRTGSGPGRAVRRLALVAPLLVCALLVTGCNGDGEDEAQDGAAPAETVAERVDSTQRFSGEKRAIARVIERFEAATRRGDRRELCSEIVVLDRDRFSRGVRDPVGDCRRNPELAPALDLRQAGGRRHTTWSWSR